MAARVLFLATTLMSSMVSLASDLLLDTQDGVWEIACAPHSWLSQACDQQGLRARRINLEQGYNLYQDKTWEDLRSLRRKHRPKRLWISLPCTKWCQWSYINYSTPERKLILAAYRRKELRMLWKMVHFIEEALDEDPLLDVFWEWPWPCIGWQQAPLQYLQTILEARGREWLRCRIDGCNYGLREKDGAGDFLRKQWLVRTTSTYFHQRFAAKTCPGGHRHSQVAGIETAKSSYYPWRMVKSIATAWRQELLSDRSQRLLFAKEDQPMMLSVEEELNVLEEQGHILPAMKAMEPAESVPSDADLQRWRARVSHFHKAAGHPTNRNLARVIRDSGAPQWKIQVALEHNCETCASLKPGGVSSGQIPPASTHCLPQAWQVIGLDTSEWLVPGLKKKARFLLMIDLATKLRVVSVIKIYPELAMQPESAEEIIESFSTSWLAHFPKPQMVVADNAKSFTSVQLHEFFHAQGIELKFPPEKEPWSHGIVEAAIADIKHTATAIHLEALENSPDMTMSLACSALNSTEFTAGFSAHQWAFGSHYAISDEDTRLWQSVGNAKTNFIRVAKARQDAEEIARKTRGQRVLSKLSNTSVRQPPRHYNVSDLVMVWRKVQAGEHHLGVRGGLRKSGRPHWVGPGRVVLSEPLAHQEPDDSRQHILWILMGKKLWRCSIHSVRPANETERLHHELTNKEDPSQWRTLADMLPQKEFIDVTSEEPGPGEIEVPDLPEQPDRSTMVPIMRAHGKQTYGPEDLRPKYGPVPYQKIHRSSPIGQDRQYVEVKNFVPAAAASSPSLPSRSKTTSSAQPPLAEDVPIDEGRDSDYEPSIAPDPVNEYDLKEPEQKKPKREDSYDLKWLEALEAEAEKEITHDDLFTTLDSYEGECLMFELDLNFSSHKQCRNFQHDPLLYLVKKLNNAEVSLKNLSAADRVLFERAKAKEVSSFLKHAAVRRCLNDEEVKNAFGSGRILKSRWVLTWKSVPPDEKEEAMKDVMQNDNTVTSACGSKRAKARIVLLGFQHPSLLDRNFKTSAPVISSMGKNMMYMVATLYQWHLEGLDLATAFLQTMPTAADDQLYTFGVPELCKALGVPEGSALRILRNIYGSTTAPRGLWLSLSQKLESLGGIPTLGERCLWCWYSKTEKDITGKHPRLIGMMGDHVDDFHRIGDRTSAEWCEVCQRIDSAYQWGTIKKGSYRHAGCDVHTVIDRTGKFSIRVEQQSYVESLADIDIPPERLRSNGPLSSHEVGACRAALGALQWLAIQTQPLLTARCNLLLTEITMGGTLEHACEIQTMIGEVRNHATVLEFFHLPDVKAWNEMIFISMGDQAHANRNKGGSTGGMVHLVSGPNSLDGRVSKMMLLSWRTWKLKRRAIGSNDAEVQSILEAEDVNFRARLLWAEIHGCRISHPGEYREDLVDVTERLSLLVKGVLCTDSRGGYDAVEVNESPLLGLSNLRAALQAFQLRDNLKRCGSELRWLASDYDLADALTKKRSECRAGLQRFLQTWEWAILFDPTFTSAKRNKSVGKSALDRLTMVQVDEGSLTEEECLLVQQFQHELQFTHTFQSDMSHPLSFAAP